MILQSIQKLVMINSILLKQKSKPLRNKFKRLKPIDNTCLNFSGDFMTKGKGIREICLN
jgi:hypothetical protein